MLIIKQIMPQLKNKVRLISLWLIISFLSEKQSWISLVLMYMRTLRWLSSLTNCLEDIIQEELLGALMIFSSFSDDEQEIVQMIDQKGS